MSCINIAAVRKLELYRGSIKPGDEDTGFAVKLPKMEEELGAENNRVDQGLSYPQVQSY